MNVKTKKTNTKTKKTKLPTKEECEKLSAWH